MRWTEDGNVLSKLDDLFDTMNKPMSDFMSAIWKHHENSADWLMLSMAATFVRDYNYARFEGLMTPDGEVHALDAEIALQYATSKLIQNPSLQTILGQGMADLANRGVIRDE